MIPMIKAIIFDVGGTYMKGSFIDFVNKSYKILGIPGKFNTKKEVYFDKELNRGRIPVEKCFKDFFKTPISEEQMKDIKKIWTTTWTPTPEMEELIEKLGEDYKLAILSNSDKANSDKFRERGWYSCFNPVILSHEEGVIKPEKEIYEITLERLGLQPEECVFIDDQESVLEPARKMGMKTIHFENIQQLKKELRQLGITF